MMNAEILNDYVDRVYAYAVRRTFSEEEAADLSQEILYTAIKSLEKLRDDNRFEPWLWGVAENVTRSFRRRMGKQREMFSYDLPLDLAAEEDGDEKDDLYSLLRLRISRLSALYRDIIILYYYDGLSTKAIAQKLSLPKGTVTWRLSEARRKIKKEFDEMEFERTALRPVRINIAISGSGNYDGKAIPFPTAYINDALSQNILYHCMEEAKSVEELSKLCGVPAYFIEDRIDNLLKRDAVKETLKDKFITDFWIRTDKYSKYFEDHAENAVVPVKDRILTAIRQLTTESREIGYHTAEKSDDELFYLCAWLASEHLNGKYSSVLPYKPHTEKYDGYRWEYIGDMRTGAYRDYSMGSYATFNNSKYAYYNLFGFGFDRRDMMSDNIIDVCADVLSGKEPEDKLSAATAIQDGHLIRRKDGTLIVTIPAFTRRQKDGFNKLTERIFAPLMDRYVEIVDKFAFGYKKMIPKHLPDVAER
ncbi:MAG: RNA polymerase sigma factor, partial [Clostridia bacterium]|nr:RNA polymerase sigma factor [Clostridia bacterium]